MLDILPWLVLAILVVMVIGLILVLALGLVQPVQVEDNILIEKLLNTISLQEGWDPVNGQPVEGDRGKCLLYNTFSLEPIVVDQLTPIGEASSLPVEFRCDDGLTLSLQKLKHTCTTAECLGINGNIYNFGQTEEYYKQCGDTTPCSTIPSAVIFDFYPPNGICLSAKNDHLQVGKCSGQPFLNVDMSVTEFGSLVRIRLPGTANCLSTDQLKISPCLSLTDQGYVWFYYSVEPSQLIAITPDLNLEEPDLSKALTLQVSPNLSLLPWSVYRSAKTSIISAYTYQNIFPG